MDRIERLNNLKNIINFRDENLDYRYDVKAYKEYLKEWLKHKDDYEYLKNGVLSFFEFWEYDIDYDFEDYDKILKIIDEFNNKQEKITNGGPGSGNHNPGQGRGVGKPADGHVVSSETQYSSKNYLSKKEFENIINYVNEDNFTEEELDAIASYAESMGYGSSCDLNQAIKKNENNDEIVERKEIFYPTDDEQIVTWKENKEFLKNKIKEKEAYDKHDKEDQEFRSKHWGDPEFKDEIAKRNRKSDEAWRNLNYDFYKPYIERYNNGDYESLDDNTKMWTLDENKLKRISILDLRKEQQSNPDKFYEKINIPRLSASSYYKEPLTTNTLATTYGNSFKDLDKLDSIIKNKGYKLDKDITVTRRVANIAVIKNQIQNQGQYTQNGITSTTAAKSIVKKMPSGIHMGDDLIRITIPKGTKVVSTYKPFEINVYKKADKYQDGKLYDWDNRNLKMIRNQNELILPSGSKFVSPGGNKLTQNDDGSYQLILKTSDKVDNSRMNRLNNILNKIFNFNEKHDKLGRFAPKLGISYGDSSIITKDGKMIDKSFKDFSELALKVKNSDEKILGKEITGKRFDIVSGDILVEQISINAEDNNRVNEIKQQIEKNKKSGVVLITMNARDEVNIRDGNHTLQAFKELKDEGKIFYIPMMLATESDIKRWENKFESIEKLETSPKTLVKVKEFKLNK